MDGDGRTARALFYWSMLRQGYWLFEFISISDTLRKAPATYARAFLYTESDENDLTYFLVHQAVVARLGERCRSPQRLKLAVPIHPRAPTTPSPDPKPHRGKPLTDRPELRKASNLPFLAMRHVLILPEVPSRLATPPSCVRSELDHQPPGATQPCAGQPSSLRKNDV